MTTRQKIEGWIQEKIEALRSKGVTEADMQEEAFEELLTDNISARHFSELVFYVAPPSNPRCCRFQQSPNLGVRFQRKRQGLHA